MEVSNAEGARQEWRTNWRMVVAAVSGFSISTIGMHSLGLFMAPMERDLGWTRTEIASGLTIFAILGAPLAPFAGALIDRYGARRLALPAIVLFCLTLASFGLARQPLAIWWAQWALLALFSLGVHTVIWTSAIAGRFVHARGLALGLTLCGTSITQIVVPPLANFLIDTFGWRQAYLYLGVGWGAVVLTLVFFFFHDAISLSKRRSPNAVPIERPVAAGLTLGEALRSLLIWRIAVTELLVSTINISLIVHMVPILLSLGLEKGRAASVAGMVGLFAIGGKLATGWLLDRVHGSAVPCLSMLVPATASLLFFASANSGVFVLPAAAIFGYGVGAYFQIVTYLATRYAGLAHFGKIFGVMSGLMVVGTGAGPLLAGLSFDRTGDYQLWLFVVIGLSLASAALVFRLGPYPDWSTR